MTDLHSFMVPTYRNMLTALSGWLDKAHAHSGDALLSARLIDDMFPLAAQIGFVCVQVQEPFYRLRGETVPEALEALADASRAEGAGLDTMEAARREIAKAQAFLETVSQDSLANRETRPVDLTLPNGMTFDMSGEEHIRDWSLPQAYFHLITAYAILRKEGIEIGKADYVPQMFAYLRQ